MQRILIFRPCHLGDMICTVPALRALRAQYPKSRVTLLGLPWAQEFAGRYSHLIDEFVEFPGWPGMTGRTPAELQRIPAFLGSMRERQFDLAIQIFDKGELANPILAL